MEFIYEQIALWSPTVASVVGIVITVVVTVYKVLRAINDFKERNKEQIQKLIEDDAQIKEDMKQIIAENIELKKRINILVDKLTKVDNYVEEKLNERNKNN